MFLNHEVVRLLATERQAALRHEVCAGEAARISRPGHDSRLGRFFAGTARRNRAMSESPWLWTRPLDVQNCDCARTMPW